MFEAFVSWLRATHVADVCSAGARDAELVRMDVRPGEPFAVESRYRFVSRDAFEAYERDHAARLRAAGIEELSRLGAAPGQGVRFQRTTGVAVAWRSP